MRTGATPGSDTVGGGPAPLAPLEVATGLVAGREPVAAPLPLVRKGGGPMAALEDVIRPALQRPPCLVSFSGGRDSSVILAVATRLSRREGLPLPVPATIRFRNARFAEESVWQELVVRHLGLDEWLRLEFDAELDTVGPFATAALRRHGLLWPFNSFFHAPLLEAARGGSLLSGVGGDEVFFTQWSLAVGWSMLTGRLRPTRRRVKTVGLNLGLSLAPMAVRRAVQGSGKSLPWLRPDAQRAYVSAMADWESRAPLRFDACMRTWWWPSRYLQLMRWSFITLASTWEVDAVHAFSEPLFLAALADSVGWMGFPSRDDAMRRLFADVLPDEVLSRPMKAAFGEVFTSRHTREFVERWSGEGVDLELVDPEVLRATWSSPEPDGRSLQLLQAAWLAADSVTGRGERPPR